MNVLLDNKKLFDLDPKVISNAIVKRDAYTRDIEGTNITRLIYIYSVELTNKLVFNFCNFPGTIPKLEILTFTKASNNCRTMHTQQLTHLMLTKAWETGGEFSDIGVRNTVLLFISKMMTSIALHEEEIPWTTVE